MVCGGGGMPGGTERLVLRGTARLLPETRSVGADKVLGLHYENLVKTRSG